MKTRFYVGLTGIILQIVAILIVALITLVPEINISSSTMEIIVGGIVLLGLNTLFVILMFSGMKD